MPSSFFLLALPTCTGIQPHKPTYTSTHAHIRTPGARVHAAGVAGRIGEGLRGQNPQDRPTRLLDLDDRDMVSVQCCDVSDEAAVHAHW